MNLHAKVWIVVGMVAMAAVAIASQTVYVRDTIYSQQRYTMNAGELTSEVLVGQTFVSPVDNLSAVGIMFATYSNRNNTHPVEFHLRNSILDDTDLRVVRVDPRQLGDNQIHTFTFEPLPDSAGREFFFYVVSPGSREGDAVTVDLSDADPYHEGSAYVVRGQGTGVTNPAILARSGKQGTDVVFSLSQTVPLRTAAIREIQRAWSLFVETWDERRGLYYIWGVGLLAAVILWSLVRLLWSEGGAFKARIGVGRLTRLLLFGLLILAVAWRVWYAVQLPLTNDEGNYLYDAEALRRGVLAGGDGYVKAPLFIGWIALWQMAAGETILAGRLASIAAGALMIFPLYFIGKHLAEAIPPGNRFFDRGRQAGLLTAAIWALFGAPIVSTVYVHTQPIALLFGVTGIAVLLAALREHLPKPAGSPGAKWFVLAGVLLGLGVASRKSILALGLVPLLLILVEERAWEMRISRLWSVGLGFLLIIGLFLGGAYAVYGEMGVREAIGANSAEDGLSTVKPEEIELVRQYSLRGMTPFFRESLPLLFLAVVGFGVAGEMVVRQMLRRKRPYRSHWQASLNDFVVAKLGWIPAWLVFLWAWNFFFEYEGGVFFGFGIEQLWWAFGGFLVLLTLWPRPGEEKLSVTDQTKILPNSLQASGAPGWFLQQRGGGESFLSRVSLLLSLFIVPLAWVGGLAFFYMNWIKFHANYIGEFLPPLAVAGGVGLLLFIQRILNGPLWRENLVSRYGKGILLGLAVVVIGGAVTVSNYITYMFEHTGTFDLSSVREAAAWAQDHIPAQDHIFTGAAVVPYLSGHRTALDIAHPRWYAYEFTRKDPERLNTFLPPAQEMLQAYRESTWFLLERQTGFSFLMEYSEIEGGLERDWVAVKEFENLGNTLVFYRRR